MASDVILRAVPHKSAVFVTRGASAFESVGVGYVRTISLFYLLSCLADILHTTVFARDQVYHVFRETVHVVLHVVVPTCGSRAERVNVS
jgi:hypothetical protein